MCVFSQFDYLYKTLQRTDFSSANAHTWKQQVWMQDSAPNHVLITGALREPRLRSLECISSSLTCALPSAQTSRSLMSADLSHMCVRFVNMT